MAPVLVPARVELLRRAVGSECARRVRWVECQLHESLLNLAVEPDTALWLRCTSYGGAAHAMDMFRPLPPAPEEDVVMTFEEWPFRRTSRSHPPEAARDIARLRHTVMQRAIDAGLSTDRAFEMGLAVTEAMTNSVRHAGGRGRLRIWQDPGAITCEVCDSGHMPDPMAGRRTPSGTETGGRGLLLVHQLSDLVQVRSSAEGSTVRITNWL